MNILLISVCQSCLDFSPQSLQLAVGTADWWAQVESNHRPHAYQACALTFWAMSPCYLHISGIHLWSSVLFLLNFTFRFFQPMVEMKGFEPLTPCLQGRCSPNWATPPYWRDEVIVKSEEVLFIIHYSFSFYNCPWKSNNNTFELCSSSSVLFLCELRVILFQSLMFSIERRWSSRTFRYGYLVTT